MLPSQNKAAAREARSQLLGELQNPCVLVAKRFFELLESLDVDVLLAAVHRIPVNPDSSDSLLPKNAFVEALADRMAMHKKDSDRVFSRILTSWNSGGRKARPAKRCAELSLLQIERAKNYFFEAAGLTTTGSLAAKLRRRHGVSLVTLFRITLAAIESTKRPEWIERQRSFEKLGAAVVGFQFCLVPSWVKEAAIPAKDAGTASKCNAKCMRHPQTKEMCEAYKWILANRQANF